MILIQNVYITHTHTHTHTINRSMQFASPLFPLGKDHLNYGVADFSGKDQRVNIFGFAGHVVSVATTQFCCCNVKSAIENM